ncbi:transmembrane protein 45b [Plakobranchus ocellatus]|uniref:Transmembrane protein 45b n=1 Tax=Plakobranchus ocellatus TaxID=259542 RepID=A0AAV3YSG6_9GAST|nr:transmembrane protein 45b [Plakobranchus ocellatus]
MGDFKGHAMPGSCLLLYGMWWTFWALRRYFMCRRSGTKFVSTATYNCGCSCGRMGVVPLEGLMKIGLSGFGMLAEITLNLPNLGMGIVQHATMYFFFLTSGCVDLCMHYGLPLPPGTDYAALALALTVEGLLFVNHLHGRSELDIQLHTLLAYVVFLTVLILLLEVKFHRSALLSLSRAYLTMLQGTWFWAVGIILYGHGKPNSAWDGDKPMEVMQATIYFSWHCAILFILMLALALIMARFYRGEGQHYRNGSELPMTRLDNGKHGEDYQPLTKEYRDEDSDIEFEQPIEKTQAPSS